MKEFYEMLAKRVSPEILSTPTTEQEQQAEQLRKAKMNMLELGASRNNERKWKNGQKRGTLSTNSLFLNKNKTPDLLKPQHPVNTLNPDNSLLGNIKGK